MHQLQSDTSTIYSTVAPVSEFRMGVSFPVVILFFLHKLENVTRLTLQDFAQFVQCGKPYRFCLAGSQYGQILFRDTDSAGYFIGFQIILSKYEIEINLYRQFLTFSDNQ
jgi:hypothetical protein